MRQVKNQLPPGVVSGTELTTLENLVAKAENATKISTTTLANRIIDIERTGTLLTKVKTLPQSVKDKLDELGDEFIKQLEKDLNHTTHGSQLASDLTNFPDDFEIYKKLKEDPAYHWELMGTEYTTNNRWQYWSQREFFKDVTGKGKFFEETTCLNALKDRTNANYLQLKNQIDNDFPGINLDDYDMFSQVQLGFPPTTLPDGRVIDYFAADQVFVKFRLNQATGLKVVDDIIVVENKLKYGTLLTDNQKYASTLSGYTVRNTTAGPSQLGTADVLSSTVNQNLNFANGSIKWYKFWDSDKGDIISGIKKL